MSVKGTKVPNLAAVSKLFINTMPVRPSFDVAR